MKLNLLDLFILVVAMTCVFSCKDDETTTLPNDSGYAFSLSVTKENEGIKLDWESINISSFERYVIVRSIDSIPDNPSPPNFSQTVTLFEVDDQDKPTFLDLNAPILGDLYYKVYIEIQDRFVLSPTIKLESNSKALPFCFNHAALVPNTNHIIIASNNFEIIKYDYLEHKVLASTVLPFQSGRLRVGDAGNGMELFATSEFNSSLVILDVDNLESINSKNFSTQIFDVIPSDKGFLFASVYDDIQPIRILDRSSLNLVDSESGQEYYKERRLVVSPKNDNKLLEISETGITLLNFSDSGQFGTSTSVSAFNNGSVKKDVSFSPDNNSFMAHQKLALYDTESLSEIFDLEFFSSTNEFDSQNPDIIYFSDFNNLFKFDMSTQDITSVFSGAEPLQVLDIGDQLILMSNGFFGGSTSCGFITVLDK